MAARLDDQIGDDLLRMAITADQFLVSLGLLDRAQIFALNIFDKGDFGGRALVEFSDDCGNLVKLGLLRSPPTPFARNDLETVADGADQDRLQDAPLGNRRG